MGESTCHLFNTHLGPGFHSCLQVSALIFLKFRANRSIAAVNYSTICAGNSMENVGVIAHGLGLVGLLLMGLLGTNF